jgi:hypothetical protein
MVTRITTGIVETTVEMGTVVPILATTIARSGETTKCRWWKEICM